MKVLIFELILIVILIPLNIVLKKHVPKWKAGERLVKRILGKLDPTSYYVLHDVTVHTESMVIQRKLIILLSRKQVYLL